MASSASCLWQQPVYVGSCPLAPWVLTWGVLALELQVSVIYWVCCEGFGNIAGTGEWGQGGWRGPGMAGKAPSSSLVFLGCCLVGVGEVGEW